MVKLTRDREVAFLIFLLLLTPISAVFGNESIGVSPLYTPLLNRLSQDGFDLQFLSRLFSDRRSDFLPVVTTLSLYPNDRQERYMKFLSPESILLSRRFLHENLKLLLEMEKRFDVDKEVAVAILLVESRFGENIGKYRVLPTLASIALMDSPEIRRRNCENLRNLDPQLSCEWVDSRSKVRAEWAYQELKCFLNIIRNEKIDPLEVFGSHAGAMGMAQFVPSSYLNYAWSEAGLEKWLLNREEAIFSIGNYLRSHGWRKDLPLQKKKEILLYYNRSTPYVETVMKVSQEIK